MAEFKTDKTCSRCNEPFYASYKGEYYCPIHLKEILAKEKQLKLRTNKKC